MATISSGVFPVYKNQFSIGKNGEKYPIADMETFNVSFENGVEEWTAMDKGGWGSKMMTAKGVKISVQGKRHIGDPGNDFVASLITANGKDAEVDFYWNFPNGVLVTFRKAVISVTECGTGEAVKVAPLLFEIHSNGKPSISLVSEDGEESEAIAVLGEAVLGTMVLGAS